MKILAIDTSGERGSIALVQDAVVVEEVALHAPDGFGQVLFQAIVDLLARHSLAVLDVDCFASAIGPGTFTGVRIGLTAAKGLAESAGKRVAGVSNLKAMAFYGEAHTRAVFADARRKDVYAAVYDSSLRLISPEVVAPLEQWLSSLQLVPDEFLCQDFATYSVVIAAREDDFKDPAALEANYVRRTDAELALKVSP